MAFCPREVLPTLFTSKDQIFGLGIGYSILNQAIFFTNIAGHILSKKENPQMTKKGVNSISEGIPTPSIWSERELL